LTFYAEDFQWFDFNFSWLDKIMTSLRITDLIDYQHILQ